MTYKKLMIDIQSNLFSFFEHRLRTNLYSDHKIIPIWIIGAPRSGTTLIYQALCSVFQCSYLTKRVGERYRIALLTRKYERQFIGIDLKPSGFSSSYGRTKNLEDPHEAGSFFYQFFPKERPYVSFKDVFDIEKKGFKKIINEITLPNEVFISKNTYHSLRVKALSKLYPSSLFVWVKRDLAATMKSIFIARNITNDVNKWWGLNPPGWEEKELFSPLEQIKWQIEETNKIIREDLNLTNANYYEINYEEFCNQPTKTVEDLLIKKNLNKRFLRDEFELPQKFKVSKLGDDEIDNNILKLLEKNNV